MIACQHYALMEVSYTSQDGMLFYYHALSIDQYHDGGNRKAQRVQDFDEGGLGMIISRRPNSRASREKAPGPRQAMAAAMAMTKVVVSLASKRLASGPGNSERAQATLPKAATVL